MVGKFVEFFGEGTRSLAVPDRATIANMAPEYGATMGFFPVDEKTLDYFEGTGRSKEEIKTFEAYFKAQGMFGVPMPGEVDYSQVVRLDLGTVTPSRSRPVNSNPTTSGVSMYTGWPSIAASASMPPTPQPTTPMPLIMVVWLSVPTRLSG